MQPSTATTEQVFMTLLTVGPRFFRQRLTWSWLFLLSLLTGITSGQRLEYQAPPLDNPLQGFVPYAGDMNHGFPHSLEFRYFALSQLLVGESQTGELQFDWSPVEDFLNEVKARGRQGIFRIHCEYPARSSQVRPEIPEFLVRRGVQVRRIRSTHAVDGEGLPTHYSISPDYENPMLRQALVQTIAALGTRYDGDPRIGFLEVGLLGFWGEWHTYPEMEQMASQAVQRQVLQAIESAFRKTKCLVRYPADGTQKQYVSNVNYNIGYHDDSFTWSTLFDRNADWHFLTRMEKANASKKWQQNPIGGELYPQLNATVFSDSCGHGGRLASDFVLTVEATHASYMRLWAVFEDTFSVERRRRAQSAVRRMGYDLHFSEASLKTTRNKIQVRAVLENRGVAPFYYNWPVHLGLLDSKGKVIEQCTVAWRVDGLLPGETRRFKTTLSPSSPLPADTLVAVRVPNPMKGGRSLRFSNKRQQRSGQGWMVLGNAIDQSSSDSNSSSNTSSSEAKTRSTLRSCSDLRN